MSRIVKKSQGSIDLDDIKLPPIRTPGPIKIWKTVDGFRTVGDESKPVKIILQEIPEDRYDDFLDHMCTYFIVDEPCCSSLKISEDPSAMQEFRDVWTIVLKQGLAVGAFVEDPKGGKPEIAGANIIGVEIKDDERKVDNYPLESTLAKRIFHPVVSICKEAKIYEHYNTDRYMYAFGLSVHPYYRGQNLGAHILSVREQIGRAYNVSVTATAFTSTISQKSAARCGYEVLLARDYDKILDEEGKEIFPNIKFKTFKVMGRRLY
ncbi:PREDICTED: uncharacterized protein LOC107069801 [Polistes dominula]|uniref:Uncharacterized protein LOC107069801 n=1 Tax=Polistes dominula TaxID=743375 RepID=A0ABM1IRR1_POLDO|nr:PREDICTED: uncharacterized protein LOC107069801 [Polistes dominula]XP_015182898.1 PREDICTED: uncharacterized protein LOC107069801 [Polistes dominula]XP_015182899.1 PREDICTED: uncharacterized protein LOC107069801 [Polistes dominula]XP_015182900.1 PREDICTED: uncharacterized protein LOC107069801 [Polistes dominula]